MSKPNAFRTPSAVAAAMSKNLGGPVAIYRPGCGACCIAPSISSPIPGMPHGKPAGVPCVQLDAQLRCGLFGDPRRPSVCSSLRPQPSMCGTDRDAALATLQRLERLTAP